MKLRDDLFKLQRDLNWLDYSIQEMRNILDKLIDKTFDMEEQDATIRKHQ